MRLVVPPVEYPPRVNQHMYQILSECSQCTCTASAGLHLPQHHWARLRLDEKARASEDDVRFDVQFSRMPASTAHLFAVDWQQLSFQVPWQVILHLFKTFVLPTNNLRSGGPGAREVVWDDGNGAIEEHAPEQHTPQTIKVERFCNILGQSLGAVCIRLKLVDGHLHQLTQVDEADQRVVPIPSISLSRVLAHEDISTKGRILLSYILAKSVWRYYDSSFMRIEWTTDSIHFMHERRLDPRTDSDSAKVDPSSPFFAMPSPELGSCVSVEQYQTGDVLHHFPRVLALGVILAEIGRKTPTTAALDSGSPKAKINDDLNSYKRVLKSPGWPALDVRNEEIRIRLRDAVGVCFDPKVFNVASTGKGQTVVDARREVIYQRVVFPLEQLCNELGIIGKPGVVQLLDYTKEGLGGQTSHCKATLLDYRSKRYVCPTVVRLLGLTMSSFPSSSVAWMECAMNTACFDIARMFRLRPSPPRVRIAILDTGYDPASSFFSLGIRKNRLGDWKDFTRPSAVPIDEDGHGTYVVSLAMKMAPAAEIFVARVAKHSHDLPKSAKNIAEVCQLSWLYPKSTDQCKAIGWAATEVRADVISMSFGFSEEPEVDGERVISNAIAQAEAARNQGILFFAAAANDGGNQAEMFPARHHAVCSVRATDHLGRFLGLNPPPNPFGADVLGTLGKCVAGAGVCGSEEVVKTGTSVATPIAAGIAATILSYGQVRCRDNFLNQEMVSILKRRHGMRSMLLQLATRMGDKEHYLHVGRFQQASDRERDAMVMFNATQSK